MTQFSHRDDPSRTASIEQTDEAVFVVHHTDAKGKARKKTFKKKYAFQAQDAAVRFLLNKEGYIVRAPQDGPLRWMARLLLDGYRGLIGHAVDPESGVVWVADGEDQIHRITPGTCQTVTQRMSSGVESPGAQLAAGHDGSVWCLTRTWDKVDDSLIRRSHLFLVSGSDELQIEQVAEVVGQNAIESVCATNDGRVLGPKAGGAALYGPDGVEEEFSCSPLEKGQPVGAVSNDGRWVVLHSGGEIQRIDRNDGTHATLPKAELERISRVQVTDEGTVFAAGFHYPSWGLWRLGDEQPQRVAESIEATVSRDGRQVVEVDRMGVTLRPGDTSTDNPLVIVEPVVEAKLGELGTAKFGRALFGSGTEVIVLNDAYTVSCIDLDKLEPTE